VRFQNFMWRDMMRSTKSKKVSVLHYRYRYIYFRFLWLLFFFFFIDLSIYDEQVVVDYLALWTIRLPYFWANWVQRKDRGLLRKVESILSQLSTVCLIYLTIYHSNFLFPFFTLFIRKTVYYFFNVP
jgi:hypothetical protein